MGDAGEMRSLAGVQRAVGCLVGAAVGDALGAPFEFGPAGRFSERFPQPVLGGVGELIGGGGFHWAPGEFTDDTQMAVIVAESLLARSGIDREHQFERFRVWARTANDVGNLTREVLSSGLPAAEAAEAVVARRGGRHTASNGSLMRVAPGAIHVAPAGRAATIAAALELSGVTHADPLCRWAVAVAHEMIRVAIAGDDPLLAVPEVLALMPDPVRAWYEPLLATGWEPGHTDVANGTAFVSLAQAVWALRRHESFEGAVTAVIDLGGDTDTVAAITGAIAGARAGIQRIPSRWQTYVHGRVPDADGVDRHYDHRALQRLAMSLYGWPHPSDVADEPVLAPVEVVPGVWATNRAGARSVDDDTAVVSLCRIDAEMRVPVRREVFLIDRPGEHNPHLDWVVRDVLDTIDAFRAEGRRVLVHCHGGRSRTGLVLTAHLMRHGRSFDEAVALLEERWPHAHLRNATFATLVRSGVL